MIPWSLFGRVLIFTGGLAACALAANEPPAPIVSPEEAARRVGEVVTVRGSVDCVSRAHTSSALYFNFGGGFPKQIFTVKYLLGEDKLPYGYFHGRTVEATGKVFSTRTGPQLQVSELEEFKLVPVDEKILDTDPATLDGRAAREHVMAAWRQVLERGDFARIDAAADRYRQGGTRFADGSFALSVLYDAVSQIDNPTPERWKAHLARLEQWEKQSPASPTPRIAHAAALLESYGEVKLEITETLKSAEDPVVVLQKMKEISEDNPGKHAREVLEQAAAIIPGMKDDPHWYVIMLRADKNPPQDDGLFAEAIRRHPDYFPIYLAQAQRYRFGTEGGAWEAFAERVRQNDPARGKELYARIVWKMNTDASGQRGIFEKSKANWDWTREGFEEILRRNPHSQWLITSFARLCWYANDGTTARALLPRLSPAPDMSVWYGDGYYQDFLFWAKQAP